MKSCSLHHWILFFFILIPVADLTLTSLTAKLNQTVTLTCNQKCSGVVTWGMSNKPDILGFCDQVTCNSEEGFEISHDQYLNGYLNLVIRSVDYSKRTIYTCYCDDKAVCNVRLIIEPSVSTFHRKSGEDLLLDLHIQEPIEVVYKHDEWICSVTAGSLQCGTDYEQRASLSHTELTLRDLKVSDSGVYTIRDMKNKEVIHKYLVSVEESAAWKTPLLVGISVVVVILVMVEVWLYWIKKENQALKMENKSLKDSISQSQAAEAEVEQIRARSNSNPNDLQLKKQIEELIEKYGNNEGRSFRTWNNTKDTPLEELLSKKKAEMDESISRMNREGPAKEEINEWWSRKKLELDEIIKEFRRTRVELELLRKNNLNVGKTSADNSEIADFRNSRRTKSWSGIQRRAKPEELVELNPIGVRSKQK